jgi:hypothetical protein
MGLKAKQPEGSIISGCSSYFFYFRGENRLITQKGRHEMKKLFHLCISFVIGLSLILFTPKDIFSAQTQVYVRLSGNLSSSASVSASGLSFTRLGDTYFRSLTSGKTYTITATSGGNTNTESVYIPYTFLVVVTIQI